MKIDFDKNNGLVPAVIQDSRTGKVLMLGYMDEAALKKTQTEGQVTFYSRSKKRLWTKGETSGNYLTAVEILTDCDGDTLLIKAIPSGPVCHRGWDTCLQEKNTEANFLFQLESVIEDRKAHPQETSYTSSLFAAGLERIAQKVGEEACEVVIAALSSQKEDSLKNEVADLLYHLLVLLSAKNVSVNQIMETLAGRHK
jgi:phosphoribosyl-ATP pyrophosphohydrolase/phosphoribosyl-AMP cyclohydrolase